MSSASARAAAASAPFVTVSNVRHRYGGGAREALAGISFSVDQGACFGLLGPNGAGKSTMFALLTGIMKLQAGEISVGGVSARADLKALRAQAAIAPQDLAFYPALTGRQNLDFFAGAYRLDHDIWRARVAKAVATCQLDAVLDQRAETYSGGLKRRLNLAIALLNQPRVLYLDEPTVGIDARSRRTILDAIAALKREGVTIIYTSHYMEEVEALCDAVAIIDQGRLLACGSIDDVLRAHGRSTFEVTFASSPPDEVRAALAGLGGAWRDGLNLTLAVTEPAALNRALEALTQSRAQIAHLQYGVARLEQAYLALLSHAETP